MNRFPQAVFIGGGQETIEGRQFTSKLVNDADELEAAQAAGWHETTTEAAEAEDAAKLAEQGKKDPVANNDEHDSDTPPTRAELEQKATELGVEFSSKLGDKKLAERIAAKLAELAA